MTRKPRTRIITLSAKVPKERSGWVRFLGDIGIVALADWSRDEGLQALAEWADCLTITGEPQFERKFHGS